jgi:hypothetical protein
LIPTLSYLSVNIRQAPCLHCWCSLWYLCISPLHHKFQEPLRNSRPTVSTALPRLSRSLSPLTYKPAYVPFKPNKSGQRLHPTYYRGCWHVVSRCLFSQYTHQTTHRLFVPVQKKFTIRRPSSSTRNGWVRLPSIAQYSLLLPPVGVWSVSQYQCGGPSSQTPYRSSPW